MAGSGTFRGETASETFSSLLHVTLPQLCSEAANHVARARIALSGETTDSAEALARLDEAISCLKRLRRHGRRQNPPRGLVSDIRDRRSA